MGSEMCIRDSATPVSRLLLVHANIKAVPFRFRDAYIRSACLCCAHALTRQSTTGATCEGVTRVHLNSDMLRSMRLCTAHTSCMPGRTNDLPRSHPVVWHCGKAYILRVGGGLHRVGPQHRSQGGTGLVSSGHRSGATDVHQPLNCAILRKTPRLLIQSYRGRFCRPFRLDPIWSGFGLDIPFPCIPVRWKKAVSSPLAVDLPARQRLKRER